MKEKLISFFDRHGGGILGLVGIAVLVFAMWSRGLLDDVYYIRRSPVTETVVFKEDSNIRPIYVSWTPSDEEQASKIAPFLSNIDESRITARELLLGNGVIGKSIVTLSYGYQGISKGLFLPIGEEGYLYLYNKEANTYKGYKVSYFKLTNNQGELNRTLQAKYGNAYSVLPWKFKTERTIQVGYLENGKVEVYLDEFISVENQSEIDEVYKDAPKPE
jgi:hypothetical protein